jgi:hypothetical protein
LVNALSLPRKGRRAEISDKITSQRRLYENNHSPFCHTSFVLFGEAGTDFLEFGVSTAGWSDAGMPL